MLYVNVLYEGLANVIIAMSKAIDSDLKRFELWTQYKSMQSLLHVYFPTILLIKIVSWFHSKHLHVALSLSIYSYTQPLTHFKLTVILFASFTSSCIDTLEYVKTSF